MQNVPNWHHLLETGNFEQDLLRGIYWSKLSLVYLWLCYPIFRVTKNCSKTWFRFNSILFLNNTLKSEFLKVVDKNFCYFIFFHEKRMRPKLIKTYRKGFLQNYPHTGDARVCLLRVVCCDWLGVRVWFVVREFGVDKPGPALCGPSLQLAVGCVRGVVCVWFVSVLCVC